ncbi:glycosyltransferase family 4 protein [Bacteroides fluxus]|uniref:glycosyltransferase family 4 protein n=1 Tax=Bacteroides fluxus TaxID=626930 RepID=UPI0026713122|nr:glycosyltransferase family 4 protein [Bacteroides fluxus]
MRIIHCIWSFNTGGAETMLVDIANEQVKTQEVYVLIVNDSCQKYLIDRLSPEVKVIFNKRNPGTRSIWPLIRLNWTLLRLRPDVIHLHNGALPKVIIPLVSRGLFLTVHALQIPLESVRRGMKLIAISEAVREDVLSRGNYDIVTIPNGIDVDAIEKRGRHNLNGKMRIVQVGRLDASKKGQDILIDALALLKQRGLKDIEVDFIGQGGSMEELKVQADQLGVSSNVHFLGLCDRNYIYSHLKEYDLMCHPSRYEGFGLTVAEGMAAMLPVLVSDEGGPYEIIDHGKLGWSFKMERTEDCAEKIAYIYHHYQEALNLVQEAFESVSMHYSVERMAGDYIKYYKDSLCRRTTINPILLAKRMKIWTYEL